MAIEIAEERLNNLESNVALLNNKFDRFEQKFDLFISKVDQRFEQIDQRFEQIDRRFEGIENRLDRLEENVEDILGIIQFTQEVGATKEDLECMATKEDLKQMATKEDLERVEENITARIEELESKQQWREVEQLKIRVSRLEGSHRMLYPEAL